MIEDEMRERMLERLHRRKGIVLAEFARVEREIEAGSHGGEEGRIWLESHALGTGVSLCCGEFTLGDSIGIDSDPRALAMDVWANVDRFPHDLPELDYVLTNYLEAFPDPLRVLQEWCKRLKKGGVIAIVARNSDAYSERMGPLVNHRRLSCFSVRTLQMYVERAGYVPFYKATLGQELRIAARKA